jgi:hypothetical protein
VGLVFCQVHVVLGLADCWTKVCWVLQTARSMLSWVELIAKPKFFKFGISSSLCCLRFFSWLLNLNFLGLTFHRLILPWTQLNFEPKCLGFGISSSPCFLELSWFVNPSVLCQTHITLGSANCRTHVYRVLHVTRATSSWVFSSNKNINKKYWLITIKAFLLVVSSSCCDACIHIQFFWTISFLTIGHIIKTSWIFFWKELY